MARLPHVLLCLLLALPAGLQAQAVLLLATGDTTLNTLTENTLTGAGFSVTVRSPYVEFGAGELAGIEAVVLLPNFDWIGDMPLASQAALVDFVEAGGGLITGEWTVWKTGTGTFAELADILPVVATSSYTYGSPVTYTQATADAVINAGLPAAFSFPGDSFLGVETYFTAKPGATVFYTSTGAAGGAGVVGWEVGNGRVLQFSTVLGPQQLADPNYSVLLANTVQWVAVPEPSAWLLLLTGLACVAVLGRRSLR